MLDRGLELDATPEIETIDVIVEIRGDLRVVRKVGIRLRHRMLGILHPLARRVDVEAFVRRGHSVLVAEYPIAADAIALLEAIEVDVSIRQRLDDGDAGRPGAD